MASLSFPGRGMAYICRIMKELDHCILCPRACGVDRNAGKVGYCRSSAGYHIASIDIHRGEEPAVSGINGICNIFFSRCNLQCLYCQNYQISRRNAIIGESVMTLDKVVEAVIKCLDKGTEAVGFVTPSHFLPHVRAIIEKLNSLNYFPVTVYNTNGYEQVEPLQSLEGIIDVYLPDFKYLDPVISGKYSDAADYPDFAKKALTEMYRQKGSTLVFNDKGQAVTGLIVRHMVLPGYTDDSIAILKWIAEELSPSVHISLMSQYYPTSCMSGHPLLNRRITVEEYFTVVKAMEDLGFYNGWTQELESADHYKPDFRRPDPFGG
jgi:putative pyruvate formate lyase activating enzyme